MRDHGVRELMAGLGGRLRLVFVMVFDPLYDQGLLSNPFITLDHQGEVLFRRLGYPMITEGFILSQSSIFMKYFSSSIVFLHEFFLPL